MKVARRDVNKDGLLWPSSWCEIVCCLVRASAVMNSHKKIDISVSSLVSLKAELSRKQEEVRAARGAAQGGARVAPVQASKNTVWSRRNAGVEERESRDAEEAAEESDLHRLSRSALEAKAKLYDRLRQAPGLEPADDRYLVDFQQKVTTGRKDEDDMEDVVSDDCSDPEDSWVEYEDCLGRTRRCLHRDLPAMKEEDAMLARSLSVAPGGRHEQEQEQEQVQEPEEARRQKLRSRWEQQEEALREKADIHYQDVLFDEARAHGVAYYAFSAAEETRAAQQQALLRRRQDTCARQHVVREQRRRRQQRMAERVRAARDRNRARRGLPPLPHQEPEPEPEPEAAPSAEEVKAAQEAEAAEQEARRKNHPVRQWDIGKEGVSAPFAPMSQEQWVHKKRAERPKEFAPMYPEDEEQPAPQRAPKTRAQEEVQLLSPIRTKPSAIINEVSHTGVEEEEEEEAPRRHGVEVPPPPSCPHLPPIPRPTCGPSMEDIERSISAGLARLRREHEERRRRGEQRPLDLM